MPSQKTKKTTSGTPRKVKKQAYKSFRLSKRIRHSAGPLPKARKIFSASMRHVLEHKKLYGGISLVYLVLMLLLVKGLAFGFGSDLPDFKSLLDELLADEPAIYTGAALFSFLLGRTGATTSDIAGLYQTLLFLVVSLAIIWALRQTHAKVIPGIKESFYKGMYPLIPFLLVLLTIILQLIPLIIGNLLYSIVLSNGLAVTGFEQVAWFFLFSVFGVLSLYMISSSIFAVYIVTLPDVTPMQALRTARELVLHRRLEVIRKILFLPVIQLILAIIIMTPILFFAVWAAEFVFFALTILAVVVMHAYMYELYRKLL